MVYTVKKRQTLVPAGRKVPNQVVFGQNAPKGFKFDARTKTETVPFWWERVTSAPLNKNQRTKQWNKDHK